MLASFGIHGVAKIKASAYSDKISDQSGRKMHVQNLEIYNDDGVLIGDISLFLNNPAAALNVGDISKLDIY